MAAGDVSESDGEEKTQPDRENIPQWSQEIRDIRPPVCIVQSTSLLPTNCGSTQLDFLGCFLDQSLIDSFVTNTNLYAISRGAVAWVPVDFA